MFIQIAAIPPSERPEGIIPVPEMEDLYISTSETDPSFYTIDYLIANGQGDVIITADHSSNLRQRGTHKIAYYYDGWDGLLFLAWMLPVDASYEAPSKYDDLVYPYNPYKG